MSQHPYGGAAPPWGPPPAAGWPPPQPVGHSTGVLLAVGGVTGLLGLLLGAALGLRLADGPEPVATSTSPPAQTAPAADLAELTVHTDGCGVIRTEPVQPLENLTWSVRDTAGFEVLGRNAEGETRYRYFSGGTYTVVLTAWVGDSYAPVSNVVTITC